LSPPTDLPFVDERSITIAAPRDRVWYTLHDFVTRTLCRSERRVLDRVLDTGSPGGFEIAAAVPTERLTLSGQHRFARYVLAFDVSDTVDDGTLLRAQTYATFPGRRGQMYESLVIRTRFHVVATNRLLRSIRRRCFDTEPRAGRRGAAIDG
jgi:hypothetical protein